MRILALALAALATAGCTTTQPLEPPPAQPGYDVAAMRARLVASARERFGAARVDEALAAPSYILAVRRPGMLPPPPPGAVTWPPPPPTALLMRSGDQWLAAEGIRWRPARVAEIDAALRLATSTAFRDEPAHIPPCPDFGLSGLVIRIEGAGEIVREALCVSQTDRVVDAALKA